MSNHPRAQAHQPRPWLGFGPQPRPLPPRNREPLLGLRSPPQPRPTKPSSLQAKPKRKPVLSPEGQQIIAAARKRWKEEIKPRLDASIDELYGVDAPMHAKELHLFVKGFDDRWDEGGAVDGFGLLDGLSREDREKIMTFRWAAMPGPRNDPVYDANMRRKEKEEAEARWRRKVKTEKRQAKRERSDGDFELHHRTLLSSTQDPWSLYHARWQLLESLPQDTPITFDHMPWPVEEKVKSIAQLNATSISLFISGLHRRSEHLTLRKTVREELLFWHPDKFEGKWKNRLAVKDADVIREGVGLVARYLTDLV